MHAPKATVSGLGSESNAQYCAFPGQVKSDPKAVWGLRCLLIPPETKGRRQRGSEFTPRALRG